MRINSKAISWRYIVHRSLLNFVKTASLHASQNGLRGQQSLSLLSLGVNAKILTFKGTKCSVGGFQRLWQGFGPEDRLVKDETMLNTSRSITPDFLGGGGEMGALMRAHDWQSTPLGPPESWPQSLRTAIRILLNTQHPMFIWWGSELIQFYNDAYRLTMGPERHPSALGQRGAECWSEIWPIIGPQIDQVMRGGGATWNEDQLVPMTRFGKLENVYWTYGFSPIDEGDDVGGVLVICRDVTRDHVAAVTLRAREAELARVQKIGRIGGLEVDLRDGFINRRSPEYLIVHGLPPEASNESHEDWVRRIHPDDREATEKQFRDAVKGDVRDYVALYRIVRPSDGEVRWISVKSIIERDESGKAIRLVGAHTDVTEHVVAEKALHDSEEEFRALTEAVPHHVWTAKPDGMLNWFNSRVYEYAGAKIGDLDGNEWGKIVYPDDVPAAVKVWSAAVQSGKPYEVEFRLRRADGVYRWFLARAVPARDATGSITRWLGTNTDIHDQKLIADETRDQFKTLVSGVRDYALLMLDPTGIVANWNVGGQRIKGYSADEIVGQHFSKFYTPFDQADGKPQRALQIALDTGVYEEEGWRVRKDGSFFWASVVIDPIFSSDGDLLGYAKITRDISERRNAEEALALIQKQLAESQKLDALGQLTGGVAHDFNNLLMIISGNIHLVKKEVSSERAIRAIHSIDNASQRAASLTRQLLTFARRQSVRPQPISLADRLESVRDVLKSGLGSLATLTIEVAEDTADIFVDPNEFETALVNLVVNARDAMLDGGSVFITAKNGTDDVEISVEDTGVGIPQDVLEKVFDPFFTTKPIGKGTGLGLSQVHGFAHQAGGSIRIESTLGKGTKITISLPRSQNQQEYHADLASTSANGTILLVEDNPEVANASTGLLEQLGYHVRWVSDASSALKEIERDDIDAVVSDIVMPGNIDGVKLAETIRKTRPNLPILLVTGYSQSTSNEFPILRKPFLIHELSQQLENLIAKGSVTEA